jgi:uncharacterized membrane protein
MDYFFSALIVAAILGASLITGLLFAFSNFVMKALAELPPETGMIAMQKINEKIINPIFLTLFFGMPALCAIIVFNSIWGMNQADSVFLLLGALAYLTGPFGITMMFNVPLNNLLASASSSKAKDIWSMYQIKWQRWNHIRTYIGALSIVFLSFGLSKV